MSDFIWPTGRGHISGAPGESGNLHPTGSVGKGSPVRTAANGGRVVTHRLRVEPSRSMRAVTGEVEALLGGLEEGQRRSGALLASELIAQVVGRAPGLPSEPVGLTIQVRKDAIRLEATGPVAPSIAGAADGGTVPPDPLAEWGRFILDRLADRWGVGGGVRRDIWAEIEVPA